MIYEIVLFCVLFCGIGLFCLWAALCVICIGGWIVQNIGGGILVRYGDWIVCNIGGGILVRPLGRGFLPSPQENCIDIKHGPSLADNDEFEGDIQGLTWSDPTLWILVFFTWPMFVVDVLDRYFKPSR